MHGKYHVIYQVELPDVSLAIFRFIICMAVPFQEVIIHTIIDVLRHKAEDLEKDEKVAIYANLIQLSL